MRVLPLILLAGAALCQDKPDGHLGKGYDALRQQRYEEAIQEFRAALKLDPKLVTRARFPLAVALFESKETAEARREFEAVRQETGDHPNVMYYLGRLDLEDRNFAGAIKNFTKALEKAPFPDTAYYLGFACFKNGELAAAEKWLKLAIQQNPNDSVAEYQLGMVYRKQNREVEAKQALAHSSEIRQRENDLSQIRIECEKKLDQGPREEAHALCQRLYDPDNAEKLTALGTIYGQHGDLEAALQPLQRAAELEPQSPQMQYNLAFTYFRMNRFDDARAPLRNALDRWPDLFPLNALYGKVLLKMGEDLAAYHALHRAHELNASDRATTELLYATALALGRKTQASREFTDSMRYFDEAVAINPEAADPHLGKAEIYAATGHPVQAAIQRQEAARLAKPQ